MGRKLVIVWFKLDRDELEIKDYLKKARRNRVIISTEFVLPGC